MHHLVKAPTPFSGRESMSSFLLFFMCSVDVEKKRPRKQKSNRNIRARLVFLSPPLQEPQQPKTTCRSPAQERRSANSVTARLGV